MSDAIAGVGTLFKVSDMASTPVFATVAEVNNIEGPSISRDTIDVTSLDSTGGYREFIGGFRDGGEVTLAMNFTRDGYVTFKDAIESSTNIDYQIVLPDAGATTFDFSALATLVGVSIPTDDKVTQNVTLKISGQVTLSS